MKQIPRQIVEVAHQLRNGEVPRRCRVRAVLKWFGVSRRGANVLLDIKTALATLGLATQPPIDEAGIDEFIRLVMPPPGGKKPEGTEAASDTESEAGPGAKTPAILVEDTAKDQEELTESGDQLEADNDEDEDEVSKPDDRPVTSQIRDWTISALRDKLERGKLVLQPKFQREYVWLTRPELPSRLIESLLLEIPIPPIYFGQGEGGLLEVIDGQQRLTTLVHFVSNKFPLRKLERMSSLNSKFFKDLSQAQQEKIVDAPISTIVIDAGGNSGLRYEIFERLNRGSVVLNEQELRNCVYRGPFNDLLADLEKDDFWRKVKGGDAPEPRFKEREMIVRFFAFANRLSNYTGNLKRFLNEYMEKYCPREEGELREQASMFTRTMENVYAVFGKQSARLYEIKSGTNGGWDPKFSVMAFDIQGSALMNRPRFKVQQVAEQIRESFLYTMLSDSELQDAISKRTGSTTQTKVRWTKFRGVVDCILEHSTSEPRFFGLEFRRDLYEKSALCQLCKNRIQSFEDSTVDHIVPFSKGGKTVPENGQLAHRICNARKNAGNCAPC